MKKIISAILSVIAICIFTTASAQVAGPFIKCDIDGKTTTFKSGVLISYNSYVAENEDANAHNLHMLTVTYDPTTNYSMSLGFFTLPHQNPVVGKLPIVKTSTSKNMEIPSVTIELSKKIKDDHIFYNSDTRVKGNIEINKVAGGWVEGKFEVELPNSFDDNAPSVKITNGSFRFKIEKEETD